MIIRLLSFVHYIANKRFLMFSQIARQVPDDGDIRQQHPATDGCEAMEQFIDLQWNEDAGNDHHQVFGPTLAQNQADSFNQAQPSINKAAEAELSDLLR